MTTEQFIKERQQLVENLRTLLSDRLDQWNVNTSAQERTVLTRLIGQQNSGTAVTLEINYCRGGSTKVSIAGVDISLSASSSEAIAGMMLMFETRWRNREQDAKQEKESVALKAMAVAMAATRISAGCKVTAVSTIETQE
jgi:hypothetical protein